MRSRRVSQELRFHAPCCIPAIFALAGVGRRENQTYLSTYRYLQVIILVCVPISWHAFAIVGEVSGRRNSTHTSFFIYFSCIVA